MFALPAGKPEKINYFFDRFVAKPVKHNKKSEKQKGESAFQGIFFGQE